MVSSQCLFKRAYTLTLLSCLLLMVMQSVQAKNDYTKLLASKNKTDSINIKIESLLKSGDNVHLMKELNAKGNLLFEHGECIDALKVLDKGIDIYKNSVDTSLLSVQFYCMDLFNTKSMIYSYLAMFDKAIESCIEIKKHNKKNDVLYDAKFYNGMGGVFAMKGEIKQSIAYYQKARKLAKKIKDETVRNNQLFLIYNNSSGSFINNQQYDSANVYILEAYKIAILMNDAQKKTAALKYFGTINRLLGNNELAINYYNESYQLAIDNELFYIVPFVKGNMAICYLEIGKIDLALGAATEAMNVARQLNMKKLEQASLEILADIYMKKGDYKTTLDYMYIAKKLNDSISNKDNENRFIQQKQGLDAYQMEVEREMILKNTQLQASHRMVQVLVVVIFLIVSLIVVSIISYLLYKRYKKHKQLSLLAEEHLYCLEEEKKAMQEEMEKQSREISLSNILSLRTSERLPAILAKFRALKSNVPLNNTSHELIKEIEELVINLVSDEDIDGSSHYLQQVSYSFYQKLENNYPELTSNEIKMCGLIWLGLPIQELINITGKSRNAINCIKFRIRRKIGIDVDIDLKDFFDTIE